MSESTDPTAAPRDAGAAVSAPARVRQLEAELLGCEDELLAKDARIEELRTQLEQADMLLDECAEARRKLQKRVDELEDEFLPPCAVSEPSPG